MNQESSADYVSNANLKGLLEWLTAEVILSRPTDPVQFCRDILGQKLIERGRGDFRSEEATEWLRACYSRGEIISNTYNIQIL